MIVYALHKGDYNFQYVGSTKLSLDARLQNHRKAAKFHDRSLVQKWINESPHLVRIEYLEEVSYDDSRVVEAKWIATLNTYNNGMNSNPKGIGNFSGVKVTKKYRDKRRAMVGKVKQSADTVEKLKQLNAEYTNTCCGRTFNSRPAFMGHKRWCKMPT